jgi:hypothetical protein
MAGILDPLTESIGNIASEFGVSPEAIKQVIRVESGGDPRASTGSYNGLTQIGPATFNENGGTLGGMTYDQYKLAPPEKQIDAYGDYLRHYDLAGQMQKHGVNLSELTPDQQFAVLQGMQFSPNGQAWKAALGQGNYNVPVTNTKQASALGDTSVAAMAGSRFGQAAMAAPGLPAPTNIASLPQPAQPISGPQSLQPQKPLPPQPLNLAAAQPQMPAYGFSPQAQPAQPMEMPQAPALNAPQLQQIVKQFNLARAFQKIPVPQGFRGYSVG